MKHSNVISWYLFKIIQKNHFVKDILYSIKHAGGKVLLVGGSVRDILLQRSIKDLDFEVYGLCLEQLQTILSAYGLVSLQGKSFGVLRVHGLDIDWSLPRKDSSGRHPIVAYDPFMTYQQAFIRRDLTINAMGIDMQTYDLIDLYGGQDDLEHKVLRSPDLSFFSQDPLRLFRVMQFVGRFEMKVDPALSAVCSVMNIGDISVERIEQEFTKLFLLSQRPSQGLLWLQEIGVLQKIMPGLTIDNDCAQKIDAAAVQVYGSDDEKICVFWAMMLFQLGIPSINNRDHGVLQKAMSHDILAIMQAMHNVSRHKDMIKKVALLVFYGTMMIKYKKIITDCQLQWLAVWLAPALSLRLLILYLRCNHDLEQAQAIYDQADQLAICDAPCPPLLTGKDFLDHAAGVQLGQLVQRAYQVQLDEQVTDAHVLKIKTLARHD